MSRLKVELREHIRYLSDFDLLSTEWLRMADSATQIANVALMETMLQPMQANPVSGSSQIAMLASASLCSHCDECNA